MVTTAKYHQIWWQPLRPGVEPQLHSEEQLLLEEAERRLEDLNKQYSHIWRHWIEPVPEEQNDPQAAG